MKVFQYFGKLDKRLKKPAIVLFILSVFIFFFLSFTSQGRALVTSANFMMVGMASQKMQEDGDDLKKPDFDVVSYPDGEKDSEGWLFVPGNKMAPAVIFSPGIGLGEQDRKLIIKAADSLRDRGMVVFIPMPDEIKRDIISVSTVESFKNAFLYLENSGRAHPDKIGYFGFCAGSDVALLASARSEISGEVAYVMAFAPYASLADFYAQAFSQKTLGDASRDWIPNHESFSLLLLNLTERLDSPSDAGIIREYFLNGGKNVEDLAQLSPQGRNLATVLSSGDAEYIRDNLPNVSQSIKEQGMLLSPLNFVSDIPAPVYLIHDRNDNFEPVEESRKLKSALGGRAKYLETSILDHTISRGDVSFWRGFREYVQIFVFFYSVFNEAY